MQLSDLPRHACARVVTVDGTATDDPIAHRLRDLGFVAGEPLRVLGHGPFGRDPILVQIGYTRFALRRSEALRVQVTVDPASGAA